MTYSEQFCNKFRSAFDLCRGSFQSEREWADVWRFKWNNFMLWNPPEPQKKAVLEATAGGMELKYWDREPLRLDAAFTELASTSIGNLPVPLVVGLEHENDIRSFNHEIYKLAYVRCRLKVGITYASMRKPTTSAEELAECQNQIVTWAKGCFETINRYTIEDERTEYLYLLGTEEPTLTLNWYAFSFTAKSGLDSRDWHTI